MMRKNISNNGPRPIMATSSNGRRGPFGREWMVIVIVEKKREKRKKH